MRFHEVAAESRPLSKKVLNNPTDAIKEDSVSLRSQKLCFRNVKTRFALSKYLTVLLVEQIHAILRVKSTR